MLICQITLNMKLPKEFTGLKIVDKSLVKFLIVSTSPETKLKAETLGQDVIKMLRQKYSILHQISELARRIKENKLDKVSFVNTSLTYMVLRLLMLIAGKCCFFVHGCLFII